MYFNGSGSGYSGYTSIVNMIAPENVNSQGFVRNKELDSIDDAFYGDSNYEIIRALDPNWEAYVSEF